MSHLTCKKHGKRVVFTDTALIHRNGKGDVCERHENPLEIISTTNAMVVKPSKASDPASILLQNIFSNDYLVDIINREMGYEEEQ